MHKKSALPPHENASCYCGGVVNWRTALVHWAAKFAGLLVHVDGFPLGSARNLDRDPIRVDPRRREIRSGSAWI